MRTLNLMSLFLIAIFAFSGCSSTGGKVDATAAAKIDRDVAATLQNLYGKTPTARTLASKAAGILVFPGIVKAGFIGGGDYGKGALLKNGKTVGYYNFSALSAGLQAGFQSYDYVMFFMNEKDLASLNRDKGFEVGVGPTVVALDAGAAKNLTTTTGKADVYSFILDQRGLMGGLNVQGSKITRINP